jgi:hypothetical protein
VFDYQLLQDLERSFHDDMYATFFSDVSTEVASRYIDDAQKAEFARAVAALRRMWQQAFAPGQAGSVRQQVEEGLDNLMGRILRTWYEEVESLARHRLADL